MNKVFLMGNMVRDVEVRHTPSNNAVSQFTIAINRKFRGKDGQMNEEKTFVDCEAWGRMAETIGKFFPKGKKIMVEGRLKLDQWEDKNGGGKRKVEGGCGVVLLRRRQARGQRFGAQARTAVRSDDTTALATTKFRFDLSVAVTATTPPGAERRTGGLGVAGRSFHEAEDWWDEGHRVWCEDGRSQRDRRYANEHGSLATRSRASEADTWDDLLDANRVFLPPDRTMAPGCNPPTAKTYIVCEAKK